MPLGHEEGTLPSKLGGGLETLHFVDIMEAEAQTAAQLVRTS